MSKVLQEILKKINDDDKVGSSNIIEKIKSELQQHNVDMYNEEISLQNQCKDTSPYYFSSDEYREVLLESAAALI